MFFNPAPVFEYGFLMNFVVSERGAGKTFSSLLYLVDNYIKTGKQFVYIRRTEAELDLATPTLLSQLHSEGFHSERNLIVKNNVLFCDGKMMGRAVAISTAYKLKSVSFHDVETIVFDEFISETGQYLKNEPEKFISLIETIGRMREIRVLCLGNQNTIYNPYYIYFNIRPVGKNFTRFRTKSILIHEFKSEAYREAKSKTKFAALISGTTYGGFMLENKAISDNYSFIDNMKSAKKQPIVNIIIEGKNLVVYDAITDSEEFVLFFIVKEQMNLKSINFDEMLIENTTIESLRSHHISRKISINLKRGSVRFNDMEAKKLIENFIF